MAELIHRWHLAHVWFALWVTAIVLCGIAQHLNDD